jgi:hypothetical protein
MRGRYVVGLYSHPRIQTHECEKWRIICEKSLAIYIGKHGHSARNLTKIQKKII